MKTVLKYAVLVVAAAALATFCYAEFFAARAGHEPAPATSSAFPTPVGAALVGSRAG